MPMVVPMNRWLFMIFYVSESSGGTVILLYHSKYERLRMQLIHLQTAVVMDCVLICSTLFIRTKVCVGNGYNNGRSRVGSK